MNLCTYSDPVNRFLELDYNLHNFFVQTPNLVFLVSLESSRSVEFIHIKRDSIGGHLIAEKFKI